MKKINEAFICSNCKKQIAEAAKTCRNHCPHCFISVHVDGEVP
ncbi:RNHCP domain-containing protein [Patescibacteria group bacterium]|nr:RNHCP domain-containing protein [Patescibacteria group bacterium]MBP7841970.1 RNHCP domain-containing protein [Patescibacteria group bacterium]